MAFAAPRSLKEPIGWRFSSLSQISPAASGTSSLTSGVRVTIPASRCRAARMSSSRIWSGVGIAQPTKLEPFARSGGDRAVVDSASRRDVLDGESQRFEQRDLLRRTTSLNAGRIDEKLADLAHDVVVTDQPFPLRHEEIPAFV